MFPFLMLGSAHPLTVHPFIRSSVHPFTLQRYDIRRDNKISPTEAQGKVTNIAREQAKEYLRQHQPFVWNATSITAQMRESLVSLFETYHAQVRIVYLETGWQTLLERNRSREDIVPQSAIENMMGKITLPEALEARKVEWLEV